MNVWILQTGEPLHCDKIVFRPMRAINLANALTDNDHKVVIFSSSFFHQQKVHRSQGFSKIEINPNLTIFLIPSIGYSKNISILRLVDHAQLAFNLYRVLRQNIFEVPDIAFIGYPPIEVAAVMISWLYQRKIPSLLDVKDLWPQIFLDSFPKVFGFLARCLLSPYFIISKYVLRRATGIISISNSFLETILDFGDRSRSDSDYVLPLVPSKVLISSVQRSNAIKFWVSQGLDLSHKQRLTFIGSLSQSFDFSFISEAIRILNQSGVFPELVICGTGNEENKIKDLFKGVPNVFFPGWIDTAQSVVLMQSTLVTIAPYKNTNDFIKSIPNKIIDSLSFGIPIITGLSGEVEHLIKQGNSGIFCDPTIYSWLSAIDWVLSNPLEISNLSSNAYYQYQQRFTFHKIYSSFVNQMEAIANAQ